MNYNVYYNYNATTSRTGKLESPMCYGVFDAQSENDAIQQADNWLRERHGDGHYKIWDIIPAAEFIDDDDYSTGF